MRRYKFLDQRGVFEAWNKLRSAFLAAKDGKEVDEIIKGILTSDERLKIGRRIIVAQRLDEDNLTYDVIKRELKVGRQTILQVQKMKINHPKCFELINKRVERVEDEYKDKAYVMSGNPKGLLKFPKYTGFRRSGIKR